MITRALRAYQTTQTETAVTSATPAELIVLVYDRLIEHLREVMALIADQQDCSDSAQKALDLITEGLIASLDTQRGGEVAANLASLYDWALRTILRARLKRDASLIEDVIKVLSPLRDAWAVASGKETVAA